MRALLFLSISLLFGSWCNAQQISEEFKNKIRQLQQEHQIPAIAVSLITPDSIFSYVNGKSRFNKKEPIPQNAKFHLGSNTKAITSFIAMRLTEEEEINWGTKFFRLFPELISDSRNTYHDITLGDLLSHSAQIRPYTTGIELSKFNNLKGTISENGYAFSKSVLAEKPVKKGTYSNAGYVLAALMLERASGKTYRELVAQTMNALDLDYTIGFPNKENLTFPWGHWDQKGALEALSPDHEYKLPDYMVSAGDISMNIKDYSTFIQLHLNGLLGKTNYLNADDYNWLHFGQNPYAYGWGNVIKEKNKMSFHDGSAGTYYCHTVILPLKNIAVVIMMNTASTNAVEAIYELQKTMTAQPQKIKN